jgi:LacI family transcriptional regulator
LSDVADEAGVHTSTASRALNAETRAVVNPETVERVLAAAQKLDYTPHPLARGLRTNRTMTVAMVIPDIENPLFGPIVAGAEETLVDAGYSLVISDASRQPETAVEALVDRRVDGLIMATAANDDDLIEDLRRRDIPVVLVNRTDGTTPGISGDDEAGIGLVVDHLIELGHKTIGHVAGPLNISTGRDRCQAFLRSIRTAGLDDSTDLVEHASWFQVAPGRAAAAQLLERRPDITALIGANDLIAMGCYQAVRDRGRVVGTDISVTGYNDIGLLELLEPPMTTVSVPYRRMGGEAASMLLQMVVDDHASVGSVQLTPRLIVRESTKPPA